MRAVILAGGEGTRLRPYTSILPKPLVPIADRPILEHILRRLAASGVREVDICIGHLGELIRLYFTEATTLPEGLELRWHWEDEPQGTAGALRLVPDLDGTFLVMNGDILTTVDYGPLVEYHRSQQSILTVAMHAERIDLDLGVIDSDNGLITGYREKPTLDFNVSMGVYVYESRAMDYLPDGPSQFPELVARLIAAGERVAACRTDAEWYDIGTHDGHERAMREVASRPEVFGL
jgi:NDP-sugar pyrophosphorylase family protein